MNPAAGTVRHMKLHEHPFASYCWKALIAFYEVDLAFERVLVEDRTELAKLWPLASIPVLEDGEVVHPRVDGDRRVRARRRSSPVPRGARLWDRLVDGHVATPMQKIVGDSLRAEDVRDPEGVRLARAELDADVRAARTTGSKTARGWRTRRSASRSAQRRPRCSTRASCTAGTSRVSPTSPPTTSALEARPSVARVIEEARPYRENFPLPWPDYVP